ncbi:amino acid adenylation domain-containing protein [Streptomyces sp. NPDC001811]
MGTSGKDTGPRQADAVREALLRKRLRGRGGGTGGGLPGIPRRTDTGPVPLTPAQHAMWVMDQLLTDNSVYGLDHVVRLRGTVDRAALGHAVADLAGRHEALRVTFTDEPRQCVQPVWQDRLAVHDLSILPAAERQAAARALVAEERDRPFDLRTGPLFRALLVVVDETESLLMLNMHHLVGDGWTVGLIAKDLSALYRARLEGTPPPEPPALRYSDYAQWQADRMKAGLAAGQLDYWRATLRDVPAVLELPTDHERPRRLSHRGHSAHRRLTPELSRAVRRLARQHGTTLFTQLLTGLQLLLGLWSGQQRFAVGAAVSGRGTAAAESLVGLFVNTVAIPVDLGAVASFTELTTQVNTAVLGALDHQDVSFEEVVAALGHPREPARNPVYQVLFQCTEAGADAWDLPGLEAEHLPGDTTSPKVDLLLSAVTGPETIDLELVSETGLFDADTGERLLGHLVTLLEQVTGDPSAPLTGIALLSPAETAVMTRDWNDTRRPYPAGLTLPDLFDQVCRRTPDAVALVAGRSTMTYAELDRAANRLAHLLRAHGATTDTPVAVAVPRSLELVVTLLAVLKAGAAYLVLDAANPLERNEALLTDSRAGLLVVASAAPDGTATTPTGHGVRTIDLDAAEVAAELRRQPSAPPSRTAGPSSLAYISYTSGSTGTPKGVMVSHRSVVRLVHEPVYARIGPDDTLLQLAPVAFDASTMELWGALLNGARLVVAPPGQLGVADIGALLREHRVTVTWLTAGLFHQMVEYDVDAFAGVRYVLAGGDVLSPEAMRAPLLRHPGLTAVACYGPTENTTFTTCQLLTDPEQVGTRVTLGRPIQQTTVYVLDDDLRPVPVGTPGQLYTGGDGVARGYLGRPDLTAERFVPDPFSDVPGARMYASGDLVRYRPDGTLDFIRRIDNQVKVRGFRIELAEIEARLLTHPKVSQAAVAAVEDAPGHKRLVAYTVAAGSGRPDAEELRDHVGQALPAYMVPQVFVPLEELPLKANGKVDRGLLPVPAPADLAGADTRVAPRNRTERLLADVWARVLRVGTVGVHDNFFELGGDSIMAIRTVAEAAKAGLRTTPRDLFEHQTVARLAAAVDDAGESTGTAIRAEQGTVAGDVELTPVHHWFTALDWPHHHHNQAVRLGWSPSPDPALLAAALDAVTAHHDALRLRLVRDGSGWSEHIAEREEGGPLRVVDLADVPAQDRDRVIEEEADRAHAAMDLTHGPIVRAVLFRTGGDSPDQLFWAVHHIAVDTVSWGVLLEDLALAYERLAAGAEAALPAKTTSYRAWAERLKDYARGSAFSAEAAFWTAHARDAEPLPVDLSGGANTEEASARLLAVLPRTATTALLQQVPAAYRTRVNDVLLTALAQTLCGWTGARTASVHLEGHGREPLFDDIDLSRTVGWFTSIHPVHLGLPSDDDPAAALKTVKEQLRLIPHSGIGYGLARYLRPDTSAVLSRYAEPQVSFNYHGRVDTGEQHTGTGPRLCRLSPVGAEAGAGGVRPHLIDVTAAVMDGELRVWWTYGTGSHHRATVQRLADDFVRRLEVLIDHCTSGAGGATPSDFPLAGLGQQALDALLSGSDARRIEDVYPLSPLQSGLLFHTLHHPGRGDYVTQLTWRITGRLDTDAFLAAWQHVTGRHAALRTTFAWEGVPEPLQIVHRHAPMTVVREDWADAGHDTDQRFADLLAAARVEPFDLERVPAHRLYLIRTGQDSHLLAWQNHHVLLDGWSVSLVLDEVYACYEALRRGEPVPALAEPTPFRRHIAWLREQDQAAARAYWQRAMEGVSGPTALPVVATTSEPGGAATTRPLTPAASVTEALQALARDNRITLNTVLQGAWGLLLARYSGQADVLFGSTLTDRMSGVAGVDRMVGLLIHTLPTRIQVAEDQPVTAWLRQVHARLTEAQRYGYSSLSEIQRHTPVPGGRRLFDSILVFTDAGAVEGRRPPTGLDIAATGGSEQPGYPLLMRADLGDRLALTLNYAPDQVDSGAAERMLGHFAQILEQMASATGGTTLGELSVLSREELRQLATGGDPGGAPEPGPTIVDLFEAQVRETPQAVAVTFQDSTTSYAQLDADADRLARRLRRAGVVPGSLVAVHLPRSLDTVVALLAVLKAGAAYLPLDPAYPDERRAYVLADSGAALVLTHSTLPAVPGCAVPSIDMDLSWEPSYGPHQPADDLPPRPRSQDLAYVIYTSGSTGRPKGVGVEHHSLAHLLGAARGLLGSHRTDTWLNLTSISFDIAALEIFLPLITGARVVVAPPAAAADPDALVALLRAERVSHVQATPSGWRVLLAGGFDDPSAVALSAGEPLPATLAATLGSRCRQLWNAYGPTETTVWSTAERVVASDGTVSIGRPLPGERVHLLDAELRPVPVGVPGELFIGGRGVARGYLGRAALTAERFVPDPYGAPGERLYRTGDRARLLPDGRLDFLGRMDSQVKVRGHRVELGEIEAALAAHPAVEQGVVVASQDTRGEVRLVAYVVPREGRQAGPAELRPFLARTLPAPMMPHAFVTLAGLPLTPNGKVDRNRLPAVEGTSLTDEREFLAPRTRQERVLAAIWAEVLEVGRVGVRDDFFELGGDSIRSLLVMTRARAAGLAVTVRQITEQRTIEAIAADCAPGAVACRTVGEFLDRLRPEDGQLLRALAAHHVPGAGAALITDGEVRTTWSWGDRRRGESAPVTADTLFQAGSLAKHVTALLAALLAQDGVLDLDRDVNDHLDTWRVAGAPGHAAPSLRALLSHTAGLEVKPGRDFPADLPVPGLAELMGGRPGQPPVFRTDPGGVGRYRYSNVGYAVVQQALEDTAGQPFAELARTRLLEPLGLRNTVFSVRVPTGGREVAAGHDHQGRPHRGGWRVTPELAGSGLWTTPSDLAALELEIWRAGAGKNPLLLGPDLAKALTDPVAEGVYGLGTMLRDSSGRRWFGHIGEPTGARCFSFVDTESGSGFVLTANADSATAAVREFLRHLGFAEELAV